MPISVSKLIRYGMDSVLPSSCWLVSGPRNCGRVALTFDDGPHPEFTPLVLNVLAEYNVRATFFVVGKEVVQYPELVLRMRDEGHAIAHHSYRHREPSRTSTAELSREIRESRALLTSFLGGCSPFFRPPKGQLTISKMFDIWQQRQTIVIWNVDPKDYQGNESRLQTWAMNYQPQGGDIVLMHDVHSWTPNYLPTLINRVREQGLGFLTIPELLNHPVHHGLPKSSGHISQELLESVTP